MRTWVGWIVILTVFIVVVGLIGRPIYMSPATDDPNAVTTDVVMVLGPPTDQRMFVAQHMIDEGHAKALMVSWDPKATQYTAAKDACTTKQTFPVFCEKPVPFSTRGEAEWLATLSQDQGWKSAAVVTFRPQITRARALMNRCAVPGLKMIDSHDEISAFAWFYQYAYQTGGFIKMGPTQEC